MLVNPGALSPPYRVVSDEQDLDGATRRTQVENLLPLATGSVGVEFRENVDLSTARRAFRTERGRHERLANGARDVAGNYEVLHAGVLTPSSPRSTQKLASLTFQVPLCFTAAPV